MEPEANPFAEGTDEGTLFRTRSNNYYRIFQVANLM
jgi:hypothetical protein